MCPAFGTVLFLGHWFPDIWKGGIMEILWMYIFYCIICMVLYVLSQLNSVAGRVALNTSFIGYMVTETLERMNER